MRTDSDIDARVVFFSSMSDRTPDRRIELDPLVRWRADQRLALQELRQKNIIKAAVLPPEFGQARGQLRFTPPSVFPFSYRAEVLMTTAKRSSSKRLSAPFMKTWQEGSIEEAFKQYGFQKHTAPVSCRRLCTPSFLESLQRYDEKHLMILTGVTACIGSGEPWYLALEYLSTADEETPFQGNTHEGYVLRFYQKKTLEALASYAHPVLLFESTEVTQPEELIK
jgi:hypothetical protein